MQDSQLYPRDIVPLRRLTPSSREAQAHWSAVDARLLLAVRKSPTHVWIRQHLVADVNGQGCIGRAELVLRYQRAFPVALAEFISPSEFDEFIRDLDTADALRQPCMPKGKAVLVVVLLFYFTIIGVLVFICVEAAANTRTRRAVLDAKAAVLRKWGEAWQTRGVRVVPRWTPELSEADDQPVDAKGDFIHDYPFLCIVLPRPPQLVVTQPPPPAAAEATVLWPGGPAVAATTQYPWQQQQMAMVPRPPPHVQPPQASVQAALGGGDARMTWGPAPAATAPLSVPGQPWGAQAQAPVFSPGSSQVRRDFDLSRGGLAAASRSSLARMFATPALLLHAGATASNWARKRRSSSGSGPGRR